MEDGTQQPNLKDDTELNGKPYTPEFSGTDFQLERPYQLDLFLELIHDYNGLSTMGNSPKK